MARLSLLDLEYRLLLQESELVWLRSLLDDLRDGLLPWPAGLKLDLSGPGAPAR